MNFSSLFGYKKLCAVNDHKTLSGHWNFLESQCSVRYILFTGSSDFLNALSYLCHPIRVK